jgi:hypothetical protein
MLSLQQNWRTRGRTGSAWKPGGWGGGPKKYTLVSKCKNDKMKERRKDGRKERKKEEKRKTCQEYKLGDQNMRVFYHRNKSKGLP